MAEDTENIHRIINLSIRRDLKNYLVLSRIKFYLSSIVKVLQICEASCVSPTSFHSAERHSCAPLTNAY